MKYLVSLLLVVGTTWAQDPADQPCVDAGGSCVDWRYYVCHGGVETGLCGGDSNRRCCLTCDSACQDREDTYNNNGQDSVCETENGGHCQPTSNFCNG